MKRAELISIGAMLLAGSVAFGGEVGFSEDFALSKDRSAALKQLIPGTPEYYYYTCLHLQNTGQLDKVVPLLKLWVERHGQSALYEQIRNRQALLGYEKEPAASLEFIRWRLGVTLDHQKDVLNKKPDLPTALDDKLISRQRLAELELNRDPANIGGFEAGALEWLAGQKLNGYQRRAMLQRLTRPDLSNLVELVVADLDFEHSGGFGSLNIHAHLTQAQLDELLKKKADLIKQSSFVFAYLSKLRPNPDADWRHDAKERQAHLDRLWEFVSRLAPAHNSIKAHVLYHRLAHDRAAGVYDKDRFGEYLKLPRGVSYVNPKYLERREMAENMCDLNADFSGQTLLVPIRADDELVRDFLMHFFAQADDWKAYQDYIDSNYLKQAFAECKLAGGQGDAEKWYSLLSPEQVAVLKDRIDLDFARTNKEIFAPDEPVAIDLLVKNVKTLIVKVYQINALNFYKQFGRQVDTDINLDGLVANEEKVVNYDDAPILRVKRHFEFESMKGRGIYVVDFIGNGKASRVLVRKGQLHFLSRTSSAGVILTVLDEANSKVPDAAAILGGQTYKADPDGTICIPYSNAAGKAPIILTQGDFACLTAFEHPPENYSISAGIHVEREAILKRRTATVAIRPTLRLNGESVSLSLLEQPRLLIQTVDLDGVPTAKEVPDIKLFEDRETTYEFQVPDRLAGISFTLTGKVQNLSKGEKIDLAASAQFPLNQIDRTDDVADVHLSRIDGKYFLDVLGKTGEGRPDVPVSFSFKHEDFTQPVHAALKTDANGRITLGELTDINAIDAELNNGKKKVWSMYEDLAKPSDHIHGLAGQTLYVPYMGKAKDASRAVLSLLEKRGSTFVKDWFANLAVKDGFIQIKDLPPGDYELTLKYRPDVKGLVGRTVNIMISAGEKRDGYVLGQMRQLQVVNERPLQIVSIDAGKDEIRIQLANSSKFARVHLAATRFMPEYSIFDNLLAGGPRVHSTYLEKPETAYQAGRSIGDEYRYIIDRKYAIKFPGNMLTRPGLLLNPWSITKTEAGAQQAQEGGYFAGGGGKAGGGALAEFGLKDKAGPFASSFGYANLDFLNSPATTIYNLQPDENGVVKIPRKDIGPHNQLHVLAVDPYNTVYRELSLSEVPEKPLDLTLSPAAALDVAKHFTEQKRITVLTAGKELAIADASTAQMEVYDTLARVHRLYSTLSRDANLAEFSFILNWPKLKDEEKRRNYSKYACHELNFFISRKDKAFFEQVVQPYLKNKKDKTFMDHYLIGDDLKEYLQPWKYERLNTVERILLGRRIKDEQAVVARHVKDMYDLMPPDVDRFNYLFLAALKGAGLDIDKYPNSFKARLRFGVERDMGVPTVSKVPVIQRSSQGIDLPTETINELQAKEIKSQMESTKKLDTLIKLQDERAADKNQEIEEHKQLADSDLARRKDARQLYRRLDKTEEYVENNYYHVPIERQNGSLIGVNAFWKDYAAFGGEGEFLSGNFAQACGSFAEMMLALAVLDLPFEAGKHESAAKDATLTIKAAGPMVVFHKEISQAPQAEQKTPILVSQNYFRADDRYTFIDNERADKYVADEFLTFVVYGCQVVVTNPTSAPQKLDVLLQLPRGAMPLCNGQLTRGLHIDLPPYNTKTVEYFFYFPWTGEFPHFPVHVAKNEKLIALCPPSTLKAVAQPSKLDTTSWDYLSQFGSGDDVMNYMQANNLGRVNLDRIVWRMADKEYFQKVLAILSARHVYNHTLWSYSLKHNDLPALREFLQHCDGLVAQCGSYLESRPLTIDPVLRTSYQHLEYAPLVNARAHKLGKARQIVNERFFGQYMRLMDILAHKQALDNDDRMAAVYYLLLQDRIEEAKAQFDAVEPAKLATAVQYDYFAAYLGFFGEDVKPARALAEKYKDYPVDRWRNLFAAVTAQLDELEGKGAKVIDAEDKAQQQAKLAATEASLDLKVESRKIGLSYQNVSEVRVNYYLMDVELLFSRNPFVQQVSGQFSFIRPNETAVVKLPAVKPASGLNEISFDLPEKFRNSNVLVEVVAGAQSRSQAYYAHSLAVQMIENYGQVKVASDKSGNPLPKVYVKVYARMKDGQVQFYKDGYTDLRGRFDYTSLNTNELENVERFSILIFSETDGAVVREAAPPKQ